MIPLSDSNITPRHPASAHPLSSITPYLRWHRAVCFTAPFHPPPHRTDTSLTHQLIWFIVRLGTSFSTFSRVTWIHSSIEVVKLLCNNFNNYFSINNIVIVKILINLFNNHIKCKIFSQKTLLLHTVRLTFSSRQYWNNVHVSSIFRALRTSNIIHTKLKHQALGT